MVKFLALYLITLNQILTNIVFNKTKNFMNNSLSWKTNIKNTRLIFLNDDHEIMWIWRDDCIETSIKYNLDKKHHFLPSDYRDPDNVARSKPSPINSNAWTPCPTVPGRGSSSGKGKKEKKNKERMKERKRKSLFDLSRQ